MTRSIAVCCLALSLVTVRVAALDYGLVLNQTIQGVDRELEYSLNAAPWFSTVLGDSGDLYLSAGFRLERAKGQWDYVPEIHRFHAGFQLMPQFNLTLGRLPYQDSLGFIASGLFDGLSLAVNFAKSRLYFGAYYTGLLYKKTANIAMNDADREQYNRTVDYGGDFFESYFAPRRMLIALGWELPDLLGGELFLEGLAQIDCNGRSSLFHTRYLSARFNRSFGSYVQAELGGSLSLVEGGSGPVKVSFAGSASLGWFPGTPLTDELRLAVRGTSGDFDNGVTVFAPVTTISQGQILRAPLNGLMLFEAAYTVRLFQTFTLGIQGALMLRTDLQSYADPMNELDPGSSSYFLGREYYASLAWAPLSDISLNLEGGAFIPFQGGAFASGAHSRWRVGLGSVISF
jgi:hypothetical protein